MGPQLQTPEAGRSRGFFFALAGVCAKRASPETLPNVPGTEREQRSAPEKANQAVLDAQTRIGDLQWLMGDPRGRRFVWRLLGRSGIYRTSFTGDALSMAFKEGERNVGLELMGEIVQHCPKGLSEMQKEARTNERRNDRSTSSRTDA